MFYNNLSKTTIDIIYNIDVLFPTKYSIQMNVLCSNICNK